MRILLLLLVLLAAGYPLGACDCNGWSGFNEVDLVFRGRLIKAIPTYADKSWGPYEITFELDSLMKGRVDSLGRVVLELPCLQVGCCGMRMTVGGDYEVYAWQDSLNDRRIFRTNQCTATHLMER